MISIIQSDGFKRYISVLKKPKRIMGYISDNQVTDLSVAEVALNYPNGIHVLSRYNIDYCCSGDTSFQDACKQQGLNTEIIWSEISHIRIHNNSHTLRVTAWESSLLIDYILQNHHAFVREEIPQIEELLDKVCAAHGDCHIELIQIRDDFNDLAHDLLSHMVKEEEILFPAMRNLEKNPALKNPIAVMEHEHEMAGTLIKSIRQLSNHYLVPRDACPTFKILYKKLEEFDQDLMQHIHLENNVLFKRAMPSGD